MALTVNNNNTLQLLNILSRNSVEQQNTLRQLTTGKRINRGSDDPAGLIALSNLNAELTAVNTSLTNNQRTDSLLTVADGAIGEISTLLSDIQGLVLASTSEANLSAAEKAANQAGIDNALDAIDRIVQNTNFNGQRLIDGSFAIATTGVAGNTNVDNVQVFSRTQASTDTTINIARTASATTASAVFAQMGGASTVRTSGSSTVSIAGALGTATITLASAQTQAQVATAINAVKDVTGVSAIQTANSVELSSTEYGSDQYVSVSVLSGGAVNSSYGTATSDSDTTNDVQTVVKQQGVDAGVTINGQLAAADGFDVSYSANGLSLAFTLGTDFGSGATAGTTTSFTVKATGGATFQLGTNSTTRKTIGVDSLSVANLGGGNGSQKLSELRSGGSADLLTNTEEARKTISQAILEVNSTRGRIGGFQKYQVGASVRALQASQTALSDATSVIGDTDFALATAQLNRQNILIQSSISLLGIANQQASQILSLL